MLRVVLTLLAVVVVATAYTPPPGFIDITTTTPAPTIATSSGRVSGRTLLSVTTNTTLNVYLGIPFAQAPVGALRWHAPVPLPPSAGEEEIDGTEYGPSCVQEPSPLVPNMSEDCLYLNVWAPVGADEAEVVEYIYGGSFTSGSTSEPFYDGASLAEAGDMVVVTLNYRLGPFGFLATVPAQAEGKGEVGNYGIQDQSAAMAWTRDNIAKFGGAPDKITLMGESAGAISVCYHLVLPEDQGTFGKAIMQSPDCNDVIPLQKALQLGDAFTTAVGCSSASPGAETLECLRNASTQQVQTAIPLAPIGSTNGASYSPVMDGVMVKAPPGYLMTLPNVVNPEIPVLLGTDKDSCTLFVMRSDASRNITYAKLKTLVADLWGPYDAQAILNQYPLSVYPSLAPAFAWADMLSDYIFRCPTRDAAKNLADGNAATFLYVFDHQPSCDFYPPALHKYLGVYHFAEVPLVFGNLVTNPAYPCSWSSLDTRVSSLLQTAWTSFVYQGDPSGDNSGAWPGYQPDAEPAFWIDGVSGGQSGGHVVHDYRKTQCDFWKDIPPPSAAALAQARALYLD